MENSSGGGCGALASVSNNTLAFEVRRALHLLTLPPGVSCPASSIP